MRISQVLSHVHLPKIRRDSVSTNEPERKSSGSLSTGWLKRAKKVALALSFAAGLGALSACAPYQYYDPNARALGGAAIGALACPNAPLACGAIGAGIGALTTPPAPVPPVIVAPPVYVQPPIYYYPRPLYCTPDWYTGFPVCH